MTPAIVLGDDPAENRRIWAEYLCRPDWIQAPAPAKLKQSSPHPLERRNGLGHNLLAAGHCHYERI